VVQEVQDCPVPGISGSQLRVRRVESGVEGAKGVCKFNESCPAIRWYWIVSKGEDGD